MCMVPNPMTFTYFVFLCKADQIFCHTKKWWDSIKIRIIRMKRHDRAVSHTIILFSTTYLLYDRIFWLDFEMINIEAYWNIVSRIRILDLQNWRTSKTAWWWIWMIHQTAPKEVRGSVQRTEDANTRTTLLERVSSRIIPDSGPLRDHDHSRDRLSHVRNTSNNR